MAFPENISDIDTNLSPPELAEIVRAVEKDRVNWISDTCSVFAGSSGGRFDYKGARFEIDEYFETVISLRIVRSEQRKLPLLR